MSKEYILLKEKSDSGIIALNKSVFESIVEISQDDIEGFQKIPTTRFSKPVSVKIVKNKLHISVDVNVKYGANVNSISKKLQNKIYNNILQMTGLKTSEITINVISFSI
ncbi:MAG: Asp23/Gls24 family envelope stress response protein [Erysipelotrichaceae bacterium]|jgi:uncharacterized alkaline shock family protein YloU|nr:Asp23/Gls24 family envelope stress response protein [Bacillota bacterium]NLP22628.1 Asp23/Gls24 family envelope stress response protein [Erysipelotrichaceae bacterium]